MICKRTVFLQYYKMSDKTFNIFYINKESRLQMSTDSPYFSTFFRFDIEIFKRVTYLVF